MAMIKCPKCNGDISDKSLQCVHCGQVLADEEQNICRECGAPLKVDDIICSKCGCPVEENEKVQESQKVQQVEVTKVNLGSNFSKKTIIIIIVAFLALIGIGFGIKTVNENKAAVEAKKASEEYEKNLETITLKMLTGAADAEECGNLIKSVWYNSIYKKADSKTDKYTRKNSGYGSFYDDFNDALSNLFSDSYYSSKIENIKKNQNEVNDLMKKMKNPSEEWKESYDDLKDYYDDYLYFTNLVINPSGSLQTFSSNFNDADTNALNGYNKMKQYLNY